MSYIIDAHEDLAYNAFTHGRNYLRSAGEIRESEKATVVPQQTGHTVLGWPEYQRGQVAVIFGTLFLAPRRYQEGPWDTQVFSEPKDARPLMEKQVSYYRRLCDEHPDHFRLVHSLKDLKSVLEPWQQSPAHLPVASPAGSENEQTPQPVVTHPVGIVMLMEGAESLREPKEIEDWYEMGVRLTGPVWAGTRLCGGTMEPGGFTSEGLELLEVMASLGMALDISHMNETSALQALDRYAGPVVATHANARALLKRAPNERHLSDLVIRRLVERDGVMGVIPFNRFLRVDWSSSDDRQSVTLRTLAAHIDHICQIAGDARHAALGTDFDGGFGWPAVPYEINTIADLQKLAPILGELGYTDESIADIFSQNWRRQLERTLPQT